MPDAPIVLVDARNVLRSQWPNIPERELVQRARTWAAENGARALVVFDGQAPDEPGNPSCEVIGTTGESADDWIVRTAGELQDEGRRYWLVTSDREVRAAAGPGAERTVGGGTFANELRPR